MAKETIYLVDGSSYVYRAYFAIKDLATSKGLPTNAIYGVTRMLLKLLSEKNPKYLLVVFDAKGPTFRHELYNQYKANRPPMPESLTIQIPIIKEIIRALGIETLELEGYEADDIIGTLARSFASQGHEVAIVSGDKDLKQLLEPRVYMWDPMKDTYISYDTFKRETGLEPWQLVEVMGLCGDSTDNIPGVPSIGEKTAIKLIQEYGSIEGVLASVDKIKGERIVKNLKEHGEQAKLSRELARIKTDVPIEPRLPPLGQKDKKVLKERFRELEFSSLWAEYAEEGVKDGEYSLIQDIGELKEIAQYLRGKKMFSLDIETTSEDPLTAEIVGLSLCLSPGKCYYIPISHSGIERQIGLKALKEELGDIFQDKEIKKIGHNIKYDAEVLICNGFKICGIDFDTMVASYVINPEYKQHNLAYLCQTYLNYRKKTYNDIVGKGKNQISFRDVDINIAKEYCCEDSDMSYRLFEVLKHELIKADNIGLFYDIEIPLIYVLIDMELTGIKIDVKLFQEMSVEFEKRLETLTKEIYRETGLEFNINSPQQLSYVLFEKLKLPVLKKTTKTKSYSTDVKVLKQLASSGPYKVPSMLLEYRTISKLKSTYLDSLVRLVNPKTGRIHTSFNQTVAATGRLSSSNPNLQNIPVRGEVGREIRKGFVAEDGHFLVSADYSQIELRIFAHYSEDPKMIDAFQNDQDIHTKTAMEILGLQDPREVGPDIRRVAKAINFGIIYGMGPHKLSEELGLDFATAKSYIDAYYQKYPGVLTYRTQMIEKARRDGYVTTLFNRRRYLPNIRSENKGLAAEAERAAINTPIQGTAADLIKKAMINIHKRLQGEGLRTKMLLQVHDELLFEVPRGELEVAQSLIKEEMEGVYELRVPLKVDMGYGENWDEAHG